MSIFTDEEVDPSFKETEIDPLPVINPAPKNGMASGTASSRRSDVDISGHAETNLANTTQPPQDQTRDTDRLLKIIAEVQEEVNSAKRNIDDLKTNFEEELDLLAESVSAFTSRISEVDALKLEVKTLKRRLQRMEQSSSSIHATLTTNDLTEDSAKHSRLAKVANMVSTKPKSSTNRVEKNGADRSSYTKLKPPAKPSPATHVNKQAHRDTGSQSSSSDTESYVSPIPAVRPGTTKFPSPSSISGTSAVALEFEPKPAITPSLKSKKKPTSTVSLNSHKVIPASDPEDEEYSPRISHHSISPFGRGSRPSRGVRRKGRPSNLGLRLPDPEWERPSWDGKPNALWSRKRGIVRRGVSGRVLNVRSEPKPRASAALWEASPAVRKSGLHGRPVNEAGIPLRPDGQPDRRYLKKNTRDKAGILRYARDEVLSKENVDLPDEASQTTLKRGHSEEQAGADESDTRSAKRPRDDESEVMEEENAELERRWGIQQQQQQQST